MNSKFKKSNFSLNYFNKILSKHFRSYLNKFDKQYRSNLYNL